MTRKLTILGGLIAAVIAIVGCDSSQPPAERASAPSGDPSPGAGYTEDHHGNKTGAHGGIVVSLGKDSYLAEAVFEKGRKVRLYMLGKEATRVQEVDARDLSAVATPAGSAEAVPVTFRPEPQPGDAKGKTSLFVATLPEELADKKVQVTVNITIGGERFRIGFGNDAHADAAMPAKLGSEKERKVFLTPGGIYTAADIKANGNTVPSVKYADLDIEHDDHPKVGDKICPISKTKANPKLTWVVGGKSYEFCCTPCVQEFVTKAKEKPDEIKDPSAYVQK